MRDKITLILVLTLSCVLLAVPICSDSDAATETFSVAYSDDLLSITGQESPEFAGSFVTMEIIDHNWSVISPAYAEIGHDGRYDTSVEILNLVPGTYGVITDVSKIGEKQVTHVYTFTIGDIFTDVHSSLNEGNLTVSGVSPDEYRGGSVTSEIRDISGNYLSPAYSTIQSDGTFSFDVYLGNSYEQLWISFSYTKSNLQNYNDVVIADFKTEESAFGQYALSLLGATEEKETPGGNKIVSVSYKSCAIGNISDVWAYDLTYELNMEDKTATIIDYKTIDSDVVLLIPSDVSFDGIEYDVDSLTPYLFQGDRSICRVFFDSHSVLTKIGEAAFRNCSLMSIELPSSLKIIDGNNFSRCSKLEDISFKLDGSYCLEKIGSGSFSDIPVKKLAIPMKNLEILSDNVLTNCFNMTELVSLDGYDKYAIGNATQGLENLENMWIYEKSGSEYTTVVGIPVHETGNICIPDGVKILKGCFSGAGNVYGHRFDYSVTLSSSVERIEGPCFNRNLSEIQIPSDSVLSYISNDAFNSSLLSEITLPTTLSDIPSNAFFGCKNLKSVEFKSATIDIGDSAFYGCTKLDSIIFAEKSDITIGKYAFHNCSFNDLNLPEGVVKIDSEAFSGCKKIKTVTLPTTLKFMESDSFVNCSNISAFNVNVGNDKFSSYDGCVISETVLYMVPLNKTEISIGCDVTSIHKDAFSSSDRDIESHDKLEKVTFENGSILSKIPDKCFNSLIGLKHFVIPSSLESIGNYSFEGCVNLSEVTFENHKESRLNTIGEGSFAKTKLTEFFLPDSLKYIGEHAFEDCYTLGIVYVGNDSSLKTIGDFAFSNTVLREFRMPSQFTDLGKSVFKGCEMLINVSCDPRNTTFSYVGGSIYEGNTLRIVSSSVDELYLDEKTNVDFDAFQPAILLKFINVDKSNPNYSSENGILLNKNKTEMLYIPKAINNLIIPKTIETINVTLENGVYNTVLHNHYFESILWKSDNITLNTGVLFNNSDIYNKNAPQIGVSSITIIAENKLILEEKSICFDEPVDVILKSSDFDISTNSVVANNVVIESLENITTIVPAYNSVNCICTNNPALAAYFMHFYYENIHNVYSDGTWNETEIEYGLFSGCYILDIHNNDLELSVETIDNYSIFVENNVNGTKYNHSEINDKKLSIFVDTNSNLTERDISVSVNDIYCSLNVEGSFEIYINDNDKLLNVSIEQLTSDIKHSVSFETNGGSVIENIQVPHGGTLVNKMPENPIKKGYSFNGWYADPECKTVFVEDSSIFDDTILYADWIFNDGKYIINYKSDYGEIVVESEGQKIISGSLLNPGTKIILEYYDTYSWEFLSWDVNGDAIGDGQKEFEITITDDTYISVNLRYLSQSNGLPSIIDVKTPEYGDDLSILWSKHYNVNTGMGTWSGFPSVPAIMDDSVYVRASDVLYKYDADTGYLDKKIDSKTIVAYYLYVGVGGGYVLDYATGKAYDADLNYAYEIPKGIDAAFYDDGYFYGLSEGKLYKFEASTGKLCSTGAWISGVAIPDWFRLYGTTSAPVFENGYLYYINAKNGDDYRGIQAINLENGSLSDRYELKNEQGRLLDDGWLTYDSNQYGKFLFITTYSTGLFDAVESTNKACIIGIKLNDDGSLTNNCKMIRVDTDNSILSSFIVYNGRGYTSGYVMDAEKICKTLSESKEDYTLLNYDLVKDEYLIYKEPFKGTHGSIVLTKAYDTETSRNVVYVYSLAYQPSDQGVYIFEDYEGKTESSGYHYQFAGDHAYGSQAVRATSSGNLIWYTDSGTVYCYGVPEKNPYKFEIVDGSGHRDISGIGKTALSALHDALDSNEIDYVITGAGRVISIDNQSGLWEIEYYEENCGVGDWYSAGMLGVNTNDSHHVFRVVYKGSTDDGKSIEAELSTESITLYESGSESQAILSVKIISGTEGSEITWISEKPDVVFIKGDNHSTEIQIVAKSLGKTNIIVTIVNGDNYIEKTCVVNVKKALEPTENKDFRFFIKMDVDADKVQSSYYSQEALEEGFNIQGMGTNAGMALEDACHKNHIPCNFITKKDGNGNDLRYWIGSMFGLGDVQMNDGNWKYWAQYGSGYNQSTLGYYYDNSIIYDIIYKITSVDGQDVNPDDVKPDKPGDKPLIDEKTETDKKDNPDGSTTTTTTTTGKTESGDDVKIVEEVTDKDGASTTKKTETVTDKDGKEVGKTVTESTKDKDGNTTSKTTGTSTDRDGNVTETESESKLDKDGYGTTETKSTTTGKDGSKVTKESVSETSENGTRETSVDRTVTDLKTTETKVTETKDAEGKTTGKETESKVTETLKDTDGNEVGTLDIKTRESVGEDGKSEKAEDISLESKDGKLRTEASSKTGKDGKSESEVSTNIRSESKDIGSDQIDDALKQSEQALSSMTADKSKVRKTVEVEVPNGTSASLSPEAVKKVSDYGAGLKVTVKEGSIDTDSSVLKNLAKDGKSVELSMESDNRSILKDKQRDIVGNNHFVDLNALVGGEKVHQLGGSATVVFSYQLKDGESSADLKVYYVDDEGNKTLVDATFENGSFTMTVNHFSVYMVESSFEPAPVGPGTSEDDGGISPALIAGIILVIAVAVAAVVLYTRKN